jgi:hypothetical protein
MLIWIAPINENRAKKVALVESEKTAIIMSILKPNYTWLATGSKSGLKYEFLKPIKDYRIIAFPDKGEYSDWFNMAKQLNKLGFKILIDDFLENTDYPNGTDLADVHINEPKPIQRPKIEARTRTRIFRRKFGSTRNSTKTQGTKTRINKRGIL